MNFSLHYLEKSSKIKDNSLMKTHFNLGGKPQNVLYWSVNSLIFLIAIFIDRVGIFKNSFE